MEPSIQTIGFEPTVDVQTELNERLFRLAGISPYDASFKVVITRVINKYEFSIVLRFVNGKMQAESHGTDLSKVMGRALDRIYKQICEWHTNRFKSESTGISANKPPHVLIIDDDPTSTEFLDFCLRKSGCTTTTVNNGHAAVNQIATQKYDLIFLDWNMPEMNGGETLLSAQNLIAHNSGLTDQFTGLRTPVITYSGESRKDISLPQCDHFRFVDHWDKSTPFHQLLNQASDVLFRFKPNNPNAA
jgi:CheY-like chemotaxis protein